MLTSKEQRDVAIIVILACLVAMAACAAGRFDLVSPRRSEVLYDREYARSSHASVPEERIDGAWRRTAKGLAMPPGGAGDLAFSVVPVFEGRLVLLLTGYDHPQFQRTIAVSADGLQFTEAATHPSLSGHHVDLSSYARSGRRLWIRLAVENSERFGDPAVAGPLPIVSRLRVVALEAPVVLPNVPLAAFLVLTPVLGYLARSTTGRTGALQFGLALLGGLALLTEAVGRSLPAPDPARWWMTVVQAQQRDHYFLWPYAVLLALVGLRDRIWISRAKSGALWVGFALAGVVAWGAANRLETLQELAGSPLGPDAVTYRQLADTLRSPYDTMYREPLWIWALRGWFELWGSSVDHQRLLSGALSVVLIWAIYKTFADYSGKPLVGLASAWLIAGNPYLIQLSTRGLREEAYLLAVLGVLYIVFVGLKRRAAWGEAWCLGLAGAATHLLRLNSYVFFFPLLLWWSWRQGAGRRWMGIVPFLFVAVLAAPHLIHNARQFGDPLYSVDVHFMWSRNYEFVLLKQTGCSGCPTKEAVEADSTTGPIIGAGEYLFGLHSVGEVFQRTLQGYAEMYLLPGDQFVAQSGVTSFWGYGFYLIGLVFALGSRCRAMLLMIPLLANGVPFAITLGIDPRIGIHTSPLVAFILAYGMVRSVEYAALRLKDRESGRPPAWAPIQAAPRGGHL